MPWATLFWVFFGRLCTGQRLSSSLRAMKSWPPKRANTRMAWIGALPGYTVSRFQGWPSARYRWSAPRNGARFRCVSRLGPPRRSESGSQGQSGRHATETVPGQTPSRASKGSPEQPPSCDHSPTRVRRLAAMRDALLKLLAGGVSWTDVGLHGHCGNHNALQIIILPKNQTSGEGGIMAVPSGRILEDKWPGSETIIPLNSKLKSL